MRSASCSLLCALLIAVVLGAPARAGIVVEGFENASLLSARGWTIANRSEPAGSVSWYQGDAATFSAQAGVPDAYLAANYNAVAGLGTVSDWLITPEFEFANGDSLTFYTRTVAAPVYPDRLEVRFSSQAGSVDVGSTSASVGDFTTLLLEINSGLTSSGYPNDWTAYTVQLSGLSGETAGRFAFRYYVTDAGVNGPNADYVGIDSVAFDVASVPEPNAAVPVAAGLAALGALTLRRRRGRAATASCACGRNVLTM